MSTPSTMATELQLQTATFAPGLTVIEASAGTGKTYSISHLVPRLLLEGTLPDLSRLLLVTFTKDAARELSERVRRVLTQLSAPPSTDEMEGKLPDLAALRKLKEDDPKANERLARALLDLDLLSVSTIHSFCQRTLQQEGTLCGLPVLPEVITDDSEYLNPIVRKQWIETLSANPILAAIATANTWKLSEALNFITAKRRCLKPTTEPAVGPYSRLFPQIEVELEQLKNEALWQASHPAIGGISKWNKGGPVDAATAIAQTEAIYRGDPGTVLFWTHLPQVDDFRTKANRVGAANQTAAARLAADPWIRSAQQLQTLATQLEWSWQQQLALDSLPKLAEVLARQRYITQDGLIGALYQALHRPPTSNDETDPSARLAKRLAERYHVALIDESQDTDPRQLAIFKRIFLDADPGRRLLLVGDPKQAIYGFRGAELSTYLAARASAQALYTLSKTRRAPAPLVGVINSLFDRSNAFLNQEMLYKPAVSALSFDQQLHRDGQPCSRLEVWLVPEEENKSYSAQPRRIAELSARIATTIVDLLEHGTLVKTDLATGKVLETVQTTPEHFAVLVATNAQAAGMAKALEAVGVPAVVNSGADVFASEEATDLHLLLRALLDPRRSARLRRALATRLIGLNATELAKLDLANGTTTAYARWLERFNQWQSTWIKRGLVALFTQLDLPDPEGNEIGVTQRLALLPQSGERRATNYRHLTDLLLETSRERVSRPDELVRWLGQQIARSESMSQAEERQLQLSSDRNAVQIVTMHKAKGLEYPLVFCPYLADPLKKPKNCEKLSGPSSQGDILLNLNLLDKEKRADKEKQLITAQLEERLRLAYVALTRARVRAWTCSYRVHQSIGSPLDWLLRTDAVTVQHPSYSEAWGTLAKSSSPSRHQEALLGLGAKRQADAGATPPPITFCEPPEKSRTRHQPSQQPARTCPSAAPADAVGITSLVAPYLPKRWTITSFSTLTKEKHAHGTPSSTPSVTGVEQAPSSELTANPVYTPPFLLAPAGAAVGTAVHDWIETWDLSELGNPADTTAPLSRYLATCNLPKAGTGQTDLATCLPKLFSDLRLIRLPGCGSTPLHELCPDAYGSEWNFHLPLAGSLSVKSLAQCFADHAAPEHREYAPMLAVLSDQEFQGLLQGFIDRLARHGEQWGVIDWKTNRLGTDLSAYDEAGLLRCAMESHYLLQTHLYLVALRRYLRCLNIHDAPILGAWLVFLRAIEPATTRGVLHIQPPHEMLDALDALFAPATATR